MKSLMTWSAPVPAKAPAGVLCPESGRPWNRMDDRDECPGCGRIVRRRGDWTTPPHRIPRWLRHGKGEPE